MELRCRDCGTFASTGWQCECGGLLAFATEPPLPASPWPAERLATEPGIWAFHEALPVGDNPVDRVTLGEGATPLLPAEDPAVSYKLEYVSPTASFKDRGAAALVTRALETGQAELVDDSSGNAGTAIAAYAGQAGLAATIFVPDTISTAKRDMLEQFGARVVPVSGSRGDVTAACQEAAQADGTWYASHAWHPAFLAGTATFAFETLLQREWAVPDAMVIPVGHGSLFVGVYEGLERLQAAGLIDGMPRLYCVQGPGVAPIVAACHGSAAVPEVPADGGGAPGIDIANPAQRPRILTAIRETGGDALAVSASAIEAATDRLHRRGIYAAPTAAVGPAGLARLHEDGEIARSDDVVVPITGSALKS